MAERITCKSCVHFWIRPGIGDPANRIGFCVDSPDKPAKKKDYRQPLAPDREQARWPNQTVKCKNYVEKAPKIDSDGTSDLSVCSDESDP